MNRERKSNQAKLQQRMGAPKNDHKLVIAEHNSTKTCRKLLLLCGATMATTSDGTHKRKRCKRAANQASTYLDFSDRH